jgi:hypothetical protein
MSTEIESFLLETGCRRHRCRATAPAATPERTDLAARGLADTEVCPSGRQIRA